MRFWAEMVMVCLSRDNFLYWGGSFWVWYHKFMKKSSTLGLIFVCLLSLFGKNTYAQTSASLSPYGEKCARNLPFGVFPTFVNTKMLEQAVVLCYDEFAVFYSGLTKTPLVVSEQLDPKRMSSAKTMKRQGEFYEERSLGDKASLLSDYRYSGYDRGHMAPSADMSNLKAQQESFSLANIVPQNHEQNGGVWASVERATRSIGAKEPIYVVTGVLFEGPKILFLQQRVAIPTSMYKIIYKPRTNEGAVYLVNNTDKATVEYLTISELEVRAKLKFPFPQPKRLFLPKPY